MELRALGRTGLRVSALGLGTAKLGRNQQVKYPEQFELPTDEQVRELLDTARGFGMNLIDTAPAYGSSEARLGALLEDRERWVIVSKAGEAFRGGVSAFDFSAAAIGRSVHTSLERLRTDWLDVVLVHAGDDDVETLRDGAALDALCDLREVGKIRAVGASTKTVAGGLLAVQRCDVVMVSLGRRDHSQLPVIEAARAAGVGVLVKKPLASGCDGDPAQALESVLAVPGVSSVLVGTIDPAHCAANCHVVERALAAGVDRPLAGA